MMEEEEDANIILHHYWSSPFAEKVRVALGAKKLKWKSLEVLPINRNRITTALTGGYRRVPVMQIGREFYCDAALILRELEKRFPGKNDAATFEAHMVASWMYDRQVFPRIVPLLIGRGGGKKNASFLAGTGVTMQEFMQDRAELMGSEGSFGGPSTKTLGAGGNKLQAQLDQVRAYMLQSEALLAATKSGLLISGSQEAGAADFSAYAQFSQLAVLHPNLFTDLPNLQAWLARIKTLGQDGIVKSCTEQDAMDAIANATRSNVPFCTESLTPQRAQVVVVVRPDDYGDFNVTGRLVHEDAHSIALERVLDNGQIVRVHFPRLGYVIHHSRSKV